jgi:predicted anti-sigma-YlaC factor YlaD
MYHAPYRETLEAAALNLLEGAERRLLDEHLVVCRSCKTDLAAYQQIVASLVYTVEPVAPPAHLRARLHERVRQLKMGEWFKL